MAFKERDSGVSVHSTVETLRNLLVQLLQIKCRAHLLLNFSTNWRERCYKLYAPIPILKIPLTLQCRKTALTNSTFHMGMEL